jgi:hypothetical protein
MAGSPLLRNTSLRHTAAARNLDQNGSAAKRVSFMMEKALLEDVFFHDKQSGHLARTILPDPL